MQCRNAVIVISLISLLSACTSKEKTPAVVSPLEFKEYNCKQISKEMLRVSGQLNQVDNNAQLNSLLSAGVTAFAISRGYGVSSDEGDEKSEYLRARYEALHQASIQKNCD